MKIALLPLSAAFVSVCLPAASAPLLPAQTLRVTVEWQKATPGPRGLLITGKIRNTGTLPLIYTQVVPLLSDQKGKVVYRGRGYLTVSPLKPGQSAEFRACADDAPAFSRMTLALRESGHDVIVDRPERPAQALPRRQARPKSSDGTAGLIDRLCLQARDDRVVVEDGLKQRPVAPSVTDLQLVPRGVE